MKTQRHIKDNIEAIAIAVVMALVIRQFAVEAFKIPTESMAPTLFGDRGNKTGDRILVDKIGPLIRGYQRWDVVVFKFPLNETKNYIKRLVGLPGETLSIIDGDIWIDGKIARKPPHVQDVLFFPACPRKGEEPVAAAQRWKLPGGNWTVKGEGEFTARSPDGESFATYGQEVRDSSPWLRTGDGDKDVGDVRLTLRATPLAAGGAVRLRIVDDRVKNDLVLAVGGSGSHFSRGDEQFDLPGVGLEPDDETEVVFANVDDAIRVEVGGKRFVYEYTTANPETSGHGADEVSFGVSGTSARFTHVKLDRDIYYRKNENCQNVVIPARSYYMLGDNSPSSRDSRLWKVQVYELPDGTTFQSEFGERETRPRPGPVPGTTVYTDLKGIERTFLQSGVKEVGGARYASFVPEANMIGRAFFVFWPLNPLTDQFRLKFIR